MQSIWGARKAHTIFFFCQKDVVESKWAFLQHLALKKVKVMPKPYFCFNCHFAHEEREEKGYKQIEFSRPFFQPIRMKDIYTFNGTTLPFL